MATHQCRFPVRSILKPLSREEVENMLRIGCLSFSLAHLLWLLCQFFREIMNLPIDYAFQLHLRDRLTLFWFPFDTGTFVFPATSILTMFYVTHDNMLTSDNSKISYRHLFSVLQNALLPLSSNPKRVYHFGRILNSRSFMALTISYSELLHTHYQMATSKPTACLSSIVNLLLLRYSFGDLSE